MVDSSRVLRILDGSCCLDGCDPGSCSFVVITRYEVPYQHVVSSLNIPGASGASGVGITDGWKEKHIHLDIISPRHIPSENESPNKGWTDEHSLPLKVHCYL